MSEIEMKSMTEQNSLNIICSRKARILSGIFEFSLPYTDTGCGRNIAGRRLSKKTYRQKSVYKPNCGF